MSALSISAADIEIVCDECHSKTVVENVPTAGATRGELFDLCQPRAVAKGWSVRRNHDGGRGFCCPACTAKIQKKLTGDLPTYSADTTCPKCGHDQVATRYWSGLEIDAPLGVPRDGPSRSRRFRGRGLRFKAALWL
jgi:DNA-directed RNA polymerase subunit RPC12/RpoP